MRMKKLLISSLILVFALSAGYFLLKVELERVTEENIRKVELAFERELQSLEKAGWKAKLHIPSEKVNIPLKESVKLLLLHRGTICAHNIEVDLKSRIGEKIHAVIEKACFLSVKEELIPVKFEQISAEGLFPKNLLKASYHSDSFTLKAFPDGRFKRFSAAIDRVLFNLSSKGRLFNLKIHSGKGLLEYKAPNAHRADEVIKILESLPPQSTAFHIAYALYENVFLNACYMSPQMKKESLKLRFRKLKFEQNLSKSAYGDFDYDMGFAATVEDFTSRSPFSKDGFEKEILPLVFSTKLEIKNISDTLMEALLHLLSSLKEAEKQPHLSEMLTILSTIVTEMTTNPPYMVFTIDLKPKTFNFHMAVKVEVERLRKLNISGSYIIKNCEKFKKEMGGLIKKNEKLALSLKSENGTCKGNFSETIPLGNMLNLTPKMP